MGWKKQNWNRLRRSPGYEMMRDVHDVVPHMPYGMPVKFTFVVSDGHVRLYINDTTQVYDYADPHPYQEGISGCACGFVKRGFEGMKVWHVVK